MKYSTYTASGFEDMEGYQYIGWIGYIYIYIYNVLLGDFEESESPNSGDLDPYDNSALVLQ